MPFLFSFIDLDKTDGKKLDGPTEYIKDITIAVSYTHLTLPTKA